MICQNLIITKKYNQNIMQMEIHTEQEIIEFLLSTETYCTILSNIFITQQMISYNNVKTITSSENFYFINKNKPKTGKERIYSLNATTTNGYTVGEPLYKDMDKHLYRISMNPFKFPQYFPNMAPLVDENVVTGDKMPIQRLESCFWYDWGNDVFDLWGHFYLYDLTSQKYYFPLFFPQNRADGYLFSQTFQAFGRIFTIQHGYPVQGIFKFDISVNDNEPFQFGAYGNMGSDGREIITNETFEYTNNFTDTTMYYVKQQQTDNTKEILYSYFLPKQVSQNNDPTYHLYHDPGQDYNSLISIPVTNGLIVYFSKTNDVKDWIVHQDIQIRSS